MLNYGNYYGIITREERGIICRELKEYCKNEGFCLYYFCLAIKKYLNR